MEGITFIDEARRGRENVLVHCVQGISRSASVVVAYLMWYKRWSFKKAMEHVKMVRYCADPNEGFRKQLIQFEREIGVDELNAKDHEYHLDQEVQIVIDGIKHPDELPLFMEKED